jgi:CDP-4-dehydro-6-deoxyglucose reductase
MVSAIVQTIESLSADVRSLQLKPHTPIAFEPGQHLLVSVRGISRCYSMARAPAKGGTLELHVKRHRGGAFSDRLLDELHTGDRIDLSGPFGEFFYPSGDDPIVMLATGTGIAPLHAMLESYLPESGDRPITLYWGARHARDLYLAERLSAWQAAYRNFRFAPVLSTDQGYVQDVATREMAYPSVTNVLACGNPQMIEAARRHFVTEAALPVRLFAADPFDAAANLIDIQSDTSDEPIALHIGSDVVAALPGVSLLVALRAAGRPILSVCGGKASCGTCLVTIDPAWSDRIVPPSKTERNLLACLPNVSSADRLACQIKLTPGLNGMSFRLP